MECLWDSCKEATNGQVLIQTSVYTNIHEAIVVIMYVVIPLVKIPAGKYHWRL